MRSGEVAGLYNGVTQTGPMNEFRAANCCVPCLRLIFVAVSNSSKYIYVCILLILSFLISDPLISDSFSDQHARRVTGRFPGEA